jgi:hypothetical protein
MANYGKQNFFESVASQRKKRRRDPPGERPKPASYGMSVGDLDKLMAGRGARRLLERLEREEGDE